MAYFLKSDISLRCFELSYPEFFCLLHMFNDVKGFELISSDDDWTLVVPIKIVKSFLNFSSTIDEFTINSLPSQHISKNW